MKTKRVKNKVKMCPCGHEERWHTGENTRCVHGHGHMMGGCSCLGFRSRRYGTGEHLIQEPMRAAPAITEDTLQRKLTEIFATLETEMAAAMVRANRRALEMFEKTPNRSRPATFTPREPISKVRHTLPENGDRSPALTRCAAALLNVFAQWHPKALNTKQACIIAGYRMSGSTSTAFAALRHHRYIEAHPTNASAWVATPAGTNASSGAKLPQGPELLAMWQSKLTTCAASILTFLHGNRGYKFTPAAICDATGYKMSGSTSTAFATLKALDLIRRTSNGLVTLNEESGL